MYVSSTCRKRNLKWHILLIEKQEPVEEENPFSLDPNSRGAASVSVSETVKNTDSGKVSLLGVDSLWGDCTYIPADLGHSNRFELFCSFHYKND